MRALTFAVMICGVTVLPLSDVYAAAESHRPALIAEPIPQLRDELATTSREERTRSVLRLSNIRLGAPPPEVSGPATLLEFDLRNDGTLQVTDVLLEVAIFEKPVSTDRSRRAMVGPFTIRGYATIEPGYTVSYQMLLRNVASDCECQPEVSIVSARPIPIQPKRDSGKDNINDADMTAVSDQPHRRCPPGGPRRSHLDASQRTAPVPVERLRRAADAGIPGVLLHGNRWRLRRLA